MGWLETQISQISQIGQGATHAMTDAPRAAGAEALHGAVSTALVGAVATDDDVSIGLLHAVSACWSPTVTA